MTSALSWFARNRVAANLLMWMILLSGGLAAVYGVRREMFPVVSLDVVAIRVPYPGATPGEVEEGILLKIEEAIADLEGIDTLDATAAESVGIVSVKVRSDADTRRVMDDIKSRVDAIKTFPKTRSGRGSTAARPSCSACWPPAAKTPRRWPGGSSSTWPPSRPPSPATPG